MLLIKQSLRAKLNNEWFAYFSLLTTAPFCIGKEYFGGREYALEMMLFELELMKLMFPSHPYHRLFMV